MENSIHFSPEFWENVQARHQEQVKRVRLLLDAGYTVEQLWERFDSIVAHRSEGGEDSAFDYLAMLVQEAKRLPVQTNAFEEQAYKEELANKDESYWSDLVPLEVIAPTTKKDLTTWLRAGIMGVWHKVRPGHKSDKS